MGYTHYWAIKRNEDFDLNKMRDSFKKVSKEIERALNVLPERNPTAGASYGEYPIKICGGSHGYPRPIINESEIWLNGDFTVHMDHETFQISTNDFYDGLYENKSNFCKTARKPYDLIVCFALISFSQHFPKDIFEYSSDGDIEDWEPAFEFYSKVTGKKIKKSNKEFIHN